MRLILLLPLLLVFGCASVKYNGSSHSSFMPTWIGKNIDSYIATVEVPDSVTELGDGRKVYKFSNVQYEYLVVDTFNGAMYCQRTFVTDSKGLILSNKWEGRCR